MNGNVNSEYVYSRDKREWQFTVNSVTLRTTEVLQSYETRFYIYEQIESIKDICVSLRNAKGNCFEILWINLKTEVMNNQSKTE